MVDDDMLEHDHVAEFHHATYGRLDDDEATDEFKRVLNYLIADRAPGSRAGRRDGRARRR